MTPLLKITVKKEAEMVTSEPNIQL